MNSTNLMNTVASNLFAARRFAGMSLQDLADGSNVTKQAISKYEKGQMSPNLATLGNLAKTLKIDIADLFKEKNEEELFYKILDLKEVNFREKERLADLDNRLMIIKKAVYEKYAPYLLLEELTNSKIKFKNPIRDFMVTDKKDAEQAALRVRKQWKIGDNPIVNVSYLLENRGVKVIEIEENIDFNGLSAWVGAECPLIVVNTSIDEVTRRRFTILHELGHLILQISEHASEGDIERICDAFASMMLMPKELLIMELGESRTSLTKDELIRIKENYGFSVKAILYSAANYGIITWDLYKAIKEFLDNDSNMGHYIFPEKALRFHQLLYMSIIENRITDTKAMELSKFSRQKIMKIKESVL